MMTLTTQPLPQRDRTRTFAIGVLPAPGDTASSAGFDYFRPTVDLRTRRHDCAQGCRSCRRPEAVVYLVGDDETQLAQLEQAHAWAERSSVKVGWVAGDGPDTPRPTLAGVLGLVAWHPNPVLLVGEHVLDSAEAGAVAAQVHAAGGRTALIPATTPTAALLAKPDGTSDG